MAMAFWPKTDYERLVELFEYVDANLAAVAPWEGWDRIYDPMAFFNPPALSKDPVAPTLYGVWGIDRIRKEDPLDPDTPGPRNLELMLSIFQEKPPSGGAATSGATLAAAEAVWAQMQAASVANLQLGPQSMNWTHAPMRDYPDFFESQITLEATSG